jgi:hypothetical protein
MSEKPNPLSRLAGCKIELFPFDEMQWRASMSYAGGGVACTADSPGTALAGLGVRLESLLYPQGLKPMGTVTTSSPAAPVPIDPKELAGLLEDRACLETLCEHASHTGDADAEPIFEIKLPCDWRKASKGLKHCARAASPRRQPSR